MPASFSGPRIPPPARYNKQQTEYCTVIKLEERIIFYTFDYIYTPRPCPTFSVTRMLTCDLFASANLFVLFHCGWNSAPPPHETQFQFAKLITRHALDRYSYTEARKIEEHAVHYAQLTQLKFIETGSSKAAHNNLYRYSKIYVNIEYSTIKYSRITNTKK